MPPIVTKLGILSRENCSYRLVNSLTKNFINYWLLNDLITNDKAITQAKR